MTEITDEHMRTQLALTRGYTVVLLKAAEGYGRPGADAVGWEHGRRNFRLRAEGLLSIVCPVADDGELCGVGIFDASVERTRELMDDDPGVRAGVFTYEVHPVRGFPGDALPGDA
ncbi:hypothetical protein F8568_028460 [Actinomadura sp. LD22]|uniref:YCII-related domain-containing protein n=1 Tax=Actinomadura physcomitrii TaxID=2650748 RepID=A0A6I4MH74_9ACTN|nr:hypothetical protein [Actinomadura physcomitrii]MWA04240.1 hypothetical protein [Actinomadura physcomitrii]